MTDQGEAPMSFALTLTLLLLGHATTAAWNSFLNNEEYFKYKLRGETFGATGKSISLDDQKDMLNCAIVMAQFNQTEYETISKYYGSQKSNCQTTKNCKQLVCENEKLAKLQLEPDSNSYYVNTNGTSTEELTVNTVDWFENFEEKLGQRLPAQESSQVKNKTHANDEGMDYVTFWGTTLSSVALVITFLSANFAGIIIPKTGENLRINIMLLIASGVFIVHIVMAWLLKSVAGFFVVTLITVVVVILTSGIAQCSFFSAIGPMPSSYIVKLMEGQGLGGIVIALLVICLDTLFKRDGKYGIEGKLEGGTAIKLNVTIFFITTILALIGAILTYHKIFKTCEEYRKIHQRTVSSTVSTNLSNEASEQKELLLTQTTKSESYVTTLTLIGCIWKMMVAVFLNFFLCLSIFPACLTSIRWQHSASDIFGIKLADWTFIKYAVFLMFNIGDWLGKRFGGVSYPSSYENLTLLLEIVKIPVFWGLFWLCDLTGTSSTPVFSNGYFFAALMLVFATSNGYFGTLPMAHAPEILEGKLRDRYSLNEINDAKSKVMPIMVASLVGGLMIGAFFSGYTVSVLLASQESSQLEFQVSAIEDLLKM